MSAAVDVLAVMDCAAETLVRMKGAEANARLVHVQRDALTEARAAVAELIQAAENVEAWITDYVPGDACGREVELRELSAALARVRGGRTDG